MGKNVNPANEAADSESGDASIDKKRKPPPGAKDDNVNVSMAEPEQNNEGKQRQQQVQWEEEKKADTDTMKTIPRPIYPLEEQSSLQQVAAELKDMLNTTDDDNEEENARTKRRDIKATVFAPGEYSYSVTEETLTSSFALNVSEEIHHSRRNHHPSVSISVEESSERIPIPESTEHPLHANSNRTRRDDGSVKSQGNIKRNINLCFVILVLVIVVVTRVGANKKDSGDDGSTTTIMPSLAPSDSPSQLPSTSSLEFLTQIQQQHAAQADNLTLSSSPQTRAYQWMINDPNLQQYSKERLEQRFALSTLYYSTQGEAWYDSSNWLSYDLPECRWHTQTSLAMKAQKDKNKCNNDGIYLHLWLDANGLVGIFPDELYLLTSLQTLSLGMNPELSSTISSQIRWLSNLEGLQMYNNGQQGGTIPTEIGMLTHLKTLGIQNNGHTGTIPSQVFRQLTNLRTANLGQNHFHGSIPASIQFLQKLRWFMVDENDLEGTIPTEIWLIRALEWINLGGNQLTGSLPTQLGQLPSILSVSLDRNGLTGTLPTQLGLLTATTFLSTAGNQFTGTLPSELGGLLTRLATLEAGDNLHTGQIPSEMGHLTQLATLTMDNNSLTGSIPPEVSALASFSLHTMDLRGNALLSGTVPDGLCHIHATCMTGGSSCGGGESGLSSSGFRMDCGNLLCGCECQCIGDENAVEDGEDPSGTTSVIIPLNEDAAEP